MSSRQEVAVRVPSATVFTFERAELESMVRESVQPPEGMYLEKVTFDVEYVDNDPYDRGPGIPTFMRAKVHFAKLKPGR